MRIVVAVLVLLASVLSAVPPDAQAQDKVTLLQGFNSMSFTPIYVARAKNFFQAENLDVDVQIVSGSSMAFKGAVGGQAPFAAMGATEFLMWVLYGSGSNSPRMLVFGGRTSATSFASTDTVWSLNLTNTPQQWTPILLSGEGAPTPREGHGAVGDDYGDLGPQTQNFRMVIFGGFGLDPAYEEFFDVWSFSLDSLTWTEITPAGSEILVRQQNLWVTGGSGRSPSAW